MRLVLASASPRRSELLRAAGIAIDAWPAHVDESPLPGESADACVRRLSQEKARAVAPHVPGRPVLAADTIVVAAGEMLGKPRDEEDAARMLRLLSGTSHQVMTGVCLGVPAASRQPRLTVDTRLAVTTVEFAPLTDIEIAWYVGTAEPMDKAGGYAVQGLASRFVRRLDGSYSNVVGLPVALVYEMCIDAGILLS